MAAAKRRRRKRRRKNALRNRIDRFMIIFAFLISVGALVTLAVLYFRQDTGIGDEQLELCLTGNTMNISWEDTESVDYIRLYRYNAITEDTKVIGDYSDNHAIIENVLSGEELTLKFEPIRVKHIGPYSFELKSNKKSVTIVPRELIVPELSDEIDVENQIIGININADSDCVCEIYRADKPNGGESESANDNGSESGDDKQTPDEPFIETENKSVLLDVGEEVEMPERGDPIRLYARTYIQEANCKQYSVVGDELEITREELLPDRVSITHGISLDANYSFSWQEAKPDTYEFMQYDEATASWIVLKTFKASDDLSYQIDWLPSEKVVAYKVRAFFENPVNEAQKAIIESPELSVRSKRTPLYCTIWPIQKLDVYAAADSNEVIGEAMAGQTLCVLEETEGNRFKVRTADTTGYIDSRFCMINLPEYLGDLCRYDITNSYSSIFRVQNYTIPGMTGYVLPGYDNICISHDEGEYVVPFLYPSAAKLAMAAEKVSEDNYVLKIYEAYRPHEATRYMYDTTELILGMQVPMLDEDGNVIGMRTENNRLMLSDEVGKNYESADVANAPSPGMPVNEQVYIQAAQQTMAEGIDISTPVGQSRIVQLTPALTLNAQAQIVLAQQEIDALSAPGMILVQDMLSKQPSYEMAMTGNGSLRLSAFLAKTVSAHNRGIALDLTLEERESGEELAMQSAMHDLSYQSILARNNDNANKLREYMTSAGFADLSSEWWHFQDDETRNSINLGVYLENGVSLKGWKDDNVGWRYQLDNGDYYRNTSETIDGVAYSFDEKGYCDAYMQ